jgi:hypothetical protein
MGNEKQNSKTQESDKNSNAEKRLAVAQAVMQTLEQHCVGVQQFLAAHRQAEEAKKDIEK